MILYEDTFGSMASKHKILCSWLDKSGLFSWVVTETCETHSSPSLQIHKQTAYGTEHSKICLMFDSLRRKNYSIAVWREMNLVGVYDTSTNSVNIYGASQPFFKKLAIDSLEDSTIIAFSGFILNNVITAFVVVFPSKALVYFIDSDEKTLLEPYYAWNTVQLDSWVESVTTGPKKTCFDCVVASDSNCLYFVYKTHIFQARLMSETESLYLTMNNQNCFVVNRWEENKSFFYKVKHFIRPYFNYISPLKDKLHDQVWKLFIFSVFDTSTAMCNLSDNLFYVKLFVETRLITDITQLRETFVDILWIVLNKYKVLVTRLVINCNVPCEHLFFIYPCLLENLKVKDSSTTHLVELFITHRSDLCIIWNDFCDVCDSYRSLWLSVLPLPAVLLSPITRMSEVQIRNITKIPDALKAPCCVSKNSLQSFSSKYNATDIFIDASGASIATKNYACFDNVDDTWSHVLHIPCSLLFHKTRPQLKSSQVAMCDTQWLSTQSMDLAAYMHFPLNKTSQIHFFRKYRFISRNKLLMKEAKHSLDTIPENEENLMYGIRRFLKNTREYETWMILAGLRLLFGQFRCALFVVDNCTERLILWVIRVTHELLQCSYNLCDESTSDWFYIYDFLVQNTMFKPNVFNLASRFRFELQQLQLCLLYGLKLKSYWGFCQDTRDTLEIDDYFIVTMRRTYKLITGILHIVHLSECWSSCFSDVSWQSLSVGILHWAQQCYDKRELYALSKNFHNIMCQTQLEPLASLHDVSNLSNMTRNVFLVKENSFEKCKNVEVNLIKKHIKENIYSNSSQTTARCCFLCYLYNVLLLELKKKLCVITTFEFNQLCLLRNWNISFAAFFGEFTFDFKNFPILQHVSHFFLYACFIGVLSSSINFNKVHIKNLTSFSFSLSYVRGTRIYWIQILLDTYIKLMGDKKVYLLP